MLNPGDEQRLAGMATARLFSAMVRIAQESRPVDGLDAFAALSRDLLDDLQACLLDLTCRPVSQGNARELARRYCDKAIGNYVHEPVSLVVDGILPKLAEALDENVEQLIQGIHSWILEHGQKAHTMAWLAEQTACLLLADAVGSTAEKQ
ncbi:hypothetical protein MQE22_08650 [Acidithiobacillus sp. YTS05]|nr:hypothetical protein MQE22_08650 [Acidithiobacillus sp. YTS05]